jgi:predicted nucleic acid-binding protein
VERPIVTTLLAALDGVRRLAVDTAPFIDLVEAHPEFGPPVRSVIERAEGGDLLLVSSVLTLTEVLTLPFDKGAAEVADAYKALLLQTPYLRLEPIGPQVAERAARLRAQHRLRTPDAIQLAVAQQAGCEAFLTNDRDLRRVDAPAVLVLSDFQEQDVEQ